jgi:hypothetical protein
VFRLAFDAPFVAASTFFRPTAKSGTLPRRKAEKKRRRRGDGTRRSAGHARCGGVRSWICTSWRRLSDRRGVARWRSDVVTWPLLALSGTTSLFGQGTRDVVSWPTLAPTGTARQKRGTIKMWRSGGMSWHFAVCGDSHRRPTPPLLTRTRIETSTKPAVRGGNRTAVLDRASFFVCESILYCDQPRPIANRVATK